MLTAFAFACAGCADDLPQATEVVHARVLGARVEVEGDPERATPAPGEKARMDFKVVFPELEQDLSSLRSMLIQCTFPTNYTGIPLCKEVTDLAQQGVTIDDLEQDFERFLCSDEDDSVRFGPLAGTCVTGAPTINLSVPQGFADRALLVRGVICERGVPFVDVALPELFGCEPNDPDDAGETMLLHGSVPVERNGDERNLNPSFEDFEVQLNGRAWPAFEGDLPAEDDCAEHANETNLPLIDPFEHRPGVRIDPAVREEVDGVPEDLELSFFVTSGELDSRFVVFEGDEDVDGDLSGSVEWHGPGREDLSKRGQLARVFVTVLDRRGGYDFTERVACLYDCLEGEVDAPVGCN